MADSSSYCRCSTSASLPSAMAARRRPTGACCSAPTLQLRRCLTTVLSLAVVVLLVLSRSPSAAAANTFSALHHRTAWGLLQLRQPDAGSSLCQQGNAVDFVGRISTLVPRGGALLIGDDDDDEEEEYDDESEEDDYDDESEEEEEEDEEEVSVEESGTGVAAGKETQQYDAPLVASPLTNLYASLAIIILARKVDLFSPTMVRIARFAFIGYLVALQIFLLYVRIQAKAANDRTPVTLSNPLSSVLQSQLGGGGDGEGGALGGALGGSAGMVKNLASSFLSTTSTAMEYDLKQATSMQSGLLLNMGFMWFLHFKMGQVQPLLIQSLTGISNAVYSPLFQVYVLGRNLERPFKGPAAKKFGEATEESEDGEEATEEPAQVEGTKDAAEETAAAVDEEEEDDDEDEVEESDEEEEEEEEEADSSADEAGDEEDQEEAAAAEEEEEEVAESDDEEDDDSGDEGEAVDEE